MLELRPTQVEHPWLLVRGLLRSFVKLRQMLHLLIVQHGTSDRLVSFGKALTTWACTSPVSLADPDNTRRHGLMLQPIPQVAIFNIVRISANG